MRAIAETLRRAVKEHKLSLGGIEGADSSRWLLVDVYDVLVHVFDPEARKFYGLELLWGDSPRIDWASIVTPSVPTGVRAHSTRAFETLSLPKS